MSGHRGVASLGTRHVEVGRAADRKFETPDGRRIEHGVILKTIAANIGGLDQPIVRGRSGTPTAVLLDHEIPAVNLDHQITGEVVNAAVLPRESAARALDPGAANRFVLDPHGQLAEAASWA